MDKVKYARTCHLFGISETISTDDKTLKDLSSFENGDEIAMTIKMDGENCVDGDTNIITENGSKTIREICENKYNGNILSFNITSGEIEFNKITNYYIGDYEDEWYEIELNDGTKLSITGNNYVYLPMLKIYRKVKYLTKDDELLFFP